MSLRWKWVAGLVAVLACGFATASGAEGPLRVMSLDQCADQFVLALKPDAELRLSPRSDDADAYLREQARAHKHIRPSLEAAVAFKPDVVVRYWGGDMLLLRRLEQGGVSVVNIEDSRDFESIRSNIRNLASSLNVPDRGEEMIRNMDARLAAAAGQGKGRRATYMTASGFSAGPGTLIDSILRAAGFKNATKAAGYQALKLEQLVLTPPLMFVRGFFEQAFMDWRGVGRHPVLKPLMAASDTADLHASTLTCPGWFAADAALTLAETAQ